MQNQQNREIKFRFWSKILKHFVIPDDDIFVGALKDKNYAVMQFTGLKDKNGEEIYEGDWIKFHNHENLEQCCEDNCPTDIVLFGKYDNEGREGIGFYLGYPDNKGKMVEGLYASFLVDDNEKEVIGNIYENPELAR